MYYIGCTRFSLFTPNSAAWHLAKLSKEDYLKRLYNENRMQERFDIFFKRAAPIYAEMANKHFYKHIIQYSSFMPEKWITKLKEETSKYDFFVLSESNENISPLPILEILKNQKSGPLAYFRVDDDDILSTDYLEHLEKYNNKSFNGMIVSFGLGLIAAYKDGKYTDFRECHRRFLALGMAFIGCYDSENKKYTLPRGGNHEKVDMASPCIIDSREIVYIWTHHKNQDTKSGEKTNPNAVNHQLSKYKKINSTDKYFSLFPTVFDEIKSFVNRKSLVTSQSDLKINKKDQAISLSSHDSSNIFNVNLKLKINENHKTKDTDKAFILSFSFEENINRAEGIALSPNKKIGWYRYIHLKDGASDLSFRIELNIPTKINSLEFQFYKHNPCDILIHEINIESD